MLTTAVLLQAKSSKGSAAGGRSSADSNKRERMEAVGPLRLLVLPTLLTTRVCVSQGELREVVFELFKDQDFWSLKKLNLNINVPEVILRSTANPRHLLGLTCFDRLL